MTATPYVLCKKTKIMTFVSATRTLFPTFQDI